MEPFATVEDLEKRWKALDESEQERAEVLIEDASAYLFSVLQQSGIEVSGKDPQAQNLKTVCCAMVRRMMGVNEKLYGVTQFTQTAGSFSEMATAANPNGDMYLTSAEKNLLGITGKKQKAVFIRPAIHRPITEGEYAW